MPRILRLPVALAALYLLSLASACAQSLPLDRAYQQREFHAVDAFSLNANPLVIYRHARANQPFSVTGERGAILGQQDGSFELWLLPVKIFHNAKLSARLEGYPALIDLNAQAAEVEVRPDHTTITYSHAAITVKQHMFVPRGQPAGLATAMVLFEVHASRPAAITLSLDPSLERQWPAPNFGRPNGSWIPAGTGGAYLLETDNPAFFGAIAMPQAAHGDIRPYQERPQTTPLTFTFTYDPAKDDAHFYPLLCSVADLSSATPQDRRALLEKTFAAGDHVQDLYRSTADYFAHFFDRRLTAHTPDKHFDEALQWAEVAIEQSKIARSDGAGLAGGWYTSGDSARPGFGWFFGRDTLWTLYAVNSYGDFTLSRQALEFLISHQREDGKMMHEYSQTADAVEWTKLPYLYASADATPLFVMQMEDYVRTTGDVAFLRAHWDNVKRAYAFTRAHTTAGAFDNSQGTGWVEEWLPKLPHQEIYLVALDQQSSEAMSRLATLMKDAELSSSAASTAKLIATLLKEFRGSDGMYAFSRDADGAYERVPSIFSSVAWWTGQLSLPDANPMFAAWAGSQFSTDWGTRSVASSAAIYDPISYHHGSVWPLYTGWVSMAEFRSGHSLAAIEHLRQNMQLTWLQDPGFVTEVLSGKFYQPLGRSSSHQLWSSAMVLSPAIRGLFGIEGDAQRHVLYVHPQLPADWNEVTLNNVRVGDEFYTVSMRRMDGSLEVEATSEKPTVLTLVAGSETPSAPQNPSTHHVLRLPLPAVEVALPLMQPREGEETSELKVIDQQVTNRRLTLTLEAPAGATQRLKVRTNSKQKLVLHAAGGDLRDDVLQLSFEGTPQSTPKYISKTVTLTW
ncbi:amylo-alpha-1,6-glucosidase [Terriglobus albidus]|uniref:amylo-alpha-1,6-glucosidase n=1 Tax=Terriglobus albidus TaxID=1592106 RepID=UPI0021DF8396|nr:glycogen debranching protein [Terriglobus albidus]